MKLRLAAAAVASALLLTGCDVKVDKGGGVSFDIAQGKASEEWTRHYSLRPGGHFEIVNINGGIEVSRADGSQVEVTAVREARANSDEAAREQLAKVQMVEEVTPTRVVVSTRGDWGNGFNMGRSRFTIRYTVRVPDGLEVAFKTENGGVRLDRVSATKTTASTTNGGIVGRDMAGSLEGATVNGGVQVGMSSVAGDVKLVAVNGGIRLDLPSDTNATLEVSAVNGGVTVDPALPMADAERQPRRVAGTLNRGGPSITAQTTNGGVRVSVSSAQRPPT